MALNNNNWAVLFASQFVWDSFLRNIEVIQSFERNSRRIVVKNLNFWEQTIPRFDDKQFKSHFRISPRTFDVLLKGIMELEPELTKLRSGPQFMDLEKQLLIAMWYFANMEYFRSVADRFGISIKGCWSVVVRISELLLKLNKEKRIIAWPNSELEQKTEEYFLTKCGFPGVVGCIDGSHIAIPAPKLYPNSYINRKKYHSVLLQAVCDENMIFTDCYAGEVGSIHDSCLFRRSTLFESISNGIINIPFDKHLLGDQGYGLKTYLMIPYKDTGSLSRQKKIYNTTLSRARSVIERAFGLLKARFSRVQKLNTRRADLIPLFIMTACILHNICIKEEDYYDESFDPDEDTTSNIGRNQISGILESEESNIARRKRDEISDKL